MDMDTIMNDPLPPSLPSSPLTSPVKLDDSTATLSLSTSTSAAITTVTATAPAASTSATTTKPQSTTAKPQSTAATKTPSKPRPARSPSPSPPPPAVVPMQTIRLTIRLGSSSSSKGDANATDNVRVNGKAEVYGVTEGYAVDIAALAKASGQRAATPVRVAKEREGDTSDSEEEAVAASAIVPVAENGNGAPPGTTSKRKKKKPHSSEYYDIHDPFIDDSELAVDERTFFGQTKQQGFYVSSGEVALLKDKTPAKKPKSSRKVNGLGVGGLSLGAGTGVGVASTAKKKKDKEKDKDKDKESGAVRIKEDEEGTRDSPIALLSDSEDVPRLPPTSAKRKKAKSGNSSEMDGVGSSRKSSLGNAFAHGEGAGTGTGTDGDDEDDGQDGAGGDEGEDGDEVVGQKRKNRYVTVEVGGKKRKVVNEASFHPDLQESFKTLKEAIAKEDWTQKGKFPPTLKPLLCAVAVQAIKLDEYDEHFFNLMPLLFPYNKFTMTKLIKRSIFPEHTQLLVDRMDNLLGELANQAKEGFANAKEEWERNVLAWDKRREKARLEAASGTGTATPGSGDETKTRLGTEEMDVDAEGGDAKDAKDKDGKDKDKDKDANHPPAKKFRMTDGMKTIVWELVLLSNECCRLENERNTLEGSILQVSEQGLRKVLYQKIVAAFPDGWMSSGQISRDVSAMKKRFEKENMENE